MTGNDLLAEAKIYYKRFVYTGNFFLQTAVISKRKKTQQLPIAQNYRELEGFQSLFHESDLAPLFHPLS